MENKRDNEVLKVEKSERSTAMDDFNQRIFPRLNRSIASLKEVSLDYYCKKKESVKINKNIDIKKEESVRSPQIKKNSAVTIKEKEVKNEKPRSGRNPQTGKEIHKCSGVVGDGVDNDCDGGPDEMKVEARERMGMEARERMSAQARHGLDNLENQNMGLREGSEDPIPGIDVIIDKDPSAIPVHFDGNDCLDCGEEPVRLSDKTAEILVKALPKIQNQG